MTIAVATTYADAIADVKARVSNSRTSFLAGMMVLPRARREAMYALYAFCREVDDIADDSPSLEVAKRGLEEWRDRISLMFRRKTSSDSITAALMPAVTAFDLVEPDFQAIIDGMEMDAAAPIDAPSEKTLDLYCDRVASAVGRVSVRIFGDTSAQAMDVAFHLGRAFQLTNILRDLAEDAARGRLYLPDELLKAHGITTREPNEVLADPRLPLVCRELAAKAKTHFQSADQAMRACKRSAMLPAKIMRAGYSEILERLLKSNWQNPSQRVGLKKARKLWLFARTYVMGQ